MSELHLQDKFLIPFFRDELGYQEVKANTITDSLIIEEDLQTFIATTKLNQESYKILLKKYSGNAPKLLADLIELIQERISSSRNMALFINANKSVTLQGIKLYLFYTDDSVIHNSSLFAQNIFSVVQELPYKYKYQGKQIWSFRPDISLFVNGIYLGYSELKSNLTNQNARKNGRGKVIKDYFEAVRVYYKTFHEDPRLNEKEKDHYHVVYSSNQDEQSSAGLNDGLTEEKALESFALKKNGLIIVVAKLQTGFDEKRLHTLFLDKEIKGIAAIQAISRVNRTTKYKNDCKIVDFSYNNINVQNLKNAFEHFSDVVVSDFDPFSDKRVLDILFTEIKKSDIYVEFFTTFLAIFKDNAKQNDPERCLDLESSIEKYINANPNRTADAKAKAAQYFTILNRIEYVITLDKKYSETTLLKFLRFFNTIYNRLHRTDEEKDAIEVYFDNQIGIIEVETKDPEPKKKQATKVAEAAGTYKIHQFNILAILEARNEQEDLKGERIRDFESKISDFFAYVRASDEGKRLIVKIKSNVSEEEIYNNFASIYLKYNILNHKTVGDYFFKEMEYLVNKLCDDFEVTVRNANKKPEA